VKALKSVEILRIAISIIVVSMTIKRVSSQRLSKISSDHQKVEYIEIEDNVIITFFKAFISISFV